MKKIQINRNKDKKQSQFKEAFLLILIMKKKALY